MADNRVRLYGQNGPGLNRNFAYNSSNSNSNSNSERRRNRERLAVDMNNIIHELYGGGNNNVRRRLFNDNNNAPPSPGRKPKAVNVSKYEKMLKNLENKNKNNNNNKNNKPNNENKNVVSWLNKGMAESKKSKIPKNKRVFLLTDLTRNGKIKHVWDRRFLNGLVESYETRYNRVREANDPFFTSPLTRNKFSKNDIKAYPPTNTTKRIIKQIMNRRVLEAEVNKIIKIKNRRNAREIQGGASILEIIKRGIRKGTITTVEQIKDLALIYKVTGRELLISGHKKDDDDYYTAYVDGKFKPHHMKFMKDAPTVIAQLYDPWFTRKSASGTVPLYKLPSAATTYLSEFEKYVGPKPNTGSGNIVAHNIKIFVVRVLRQVVRDGYVNYLRKETMKEINTFKNAKLRNELSEYYNWHELVRNASS